MILRRIWKWCVLIEGNTHTHAGRQIYAPSLIHTKTHTHTHAHSCVRRKKEIHSPIQIETETQTHTHTHAGRLIRKHRNAIMTMRLMSRVFTNGQGDRGSIPCRVIPKTQKWYLIHPCLTLSIIRYVSRVKWSTPGKGVALFLPPRYCSYWKGTLEKGGLRLRSPTLLT